MPLAAEHVAATKPADCLDDAVLSRPRFDDEVVAEPFDRLMVNAVDPVQVTFWKEASEPRLALDFDTVVEFVVEHVVAMPASAWALFDDVLEQRAAAGDVDQLRAAADAENRLTLKNEFPDQLDLE